MTKDSIETLKNRLESFKLSEYCALEEFQSYFEDCNELLRTSDIRAKERAIFHMKRGLSFVSFAKALPESAPNYLVDVLQAILSQEKNAENLLLELAHGSLFSKIQKDVLGNWLEENEKEGAITSAVANIARVEAEIYPEGDWNTVKGFLEPFFEHSDDRLRAAAGNAYGQMYLDGVDNLPPIAETLEKVKRMEIKRPGFAGPFLGQLLMDSNESSVLSSSETDLESWIIEIISKRSSDEPEVPFYVGIDFHAHEIFSCNPSAVSKLIEIGALDVAAMAATEEDRPIRGMKKHLEVLATSTDYFISRICSWHLADCYKTIHPEGQKKGFVRKEIRDEVEILLMFDPEKELEPYAATIYPISSDLTDSIAWKWIDKLVPPTTRPVLGTDTLQPNPCLEDDSVTFYHEQFIFSFFGKVNEKLWKRVWVKYPLDSSKW